MLLTLGQIIDLTGYKQPSKQVRALRSMGVRHFVRLDGRPIVDESALSTQTGTSQTEPKWSAING